LGSASITKKRRVFSTFLIAAMVYPTELSQFLFRGFLGAFVDEFVVYTFCLGLIKFFIRSLEVGDRNFLGSFLAV
jgi:hypothetical protein